MHYPNSISKIDSFGDRLHQFSLAAAEAIDELIALSPSAMSVEGSLVDGAMLRRYNELVQNIRRMAHDYDLTGLQSICALVENNLLLLKDCEHTVTADECFTLEEWPQLLFGYLMNQADLESSTVFLKNLSSNWPICLPEESTTDELQLLMGQTASTPEPSPATEPFARPAADTVPQQIEREMLDTLVSELALMDEQFHADLDTATNGPDAERETALANYLDFLERLSFTVESVGLTALAALLDQLHRQIKLLNGGLATTQQSLLEQLPEHLAAYLIDPGAASTGSELLDLLGDDAWPTPLSAEVILSWQETLASVQISETTPQLEARQEHASQEDVSLEIADDVHPELLNGLLLELPVQVSAFSDAIEQISLGTGDTTDIERAMRAAHTLKGAANTVGVAGIANLTHQLEDILAVLLSAQTLPQRALADVLINASDCLETMSEYLLGMGPAPEQTLEVLQEVLNCATQIDKQGVDAYTTEIEIATPSSEVNSSASESQKLQAVMPHPASDEPETPNPAAEQSLRIPAPLVDELLRLSGETLTSNSQIQERLRQSVNQTDLIRKQHRLLQQLVTELEELVDIRGISSPQLAMEYKGENFDDLEFEHYNELHTVTRRLMEAATDAQELTDSIENHLGALEETLDDQHRLQTANQNAVIRIRMVTVSSVVSRLKRGVRQTARLLDKAVTFTIKGENTSIDGNVLNDLMDPLMHILRNAVDHGVESPDARVAAGKSPEGHIELSFAREGNSIVVRCKDDGPGLDYEAILLSAQGKGMIRPDYNYRDDELERLILLPGFSTRGSASQVSGRGVGMDVVQSRVQEKKGSLTLNSRPGQGLTVEMRLPATLLSTHTLIVRQRDKYLAISSRNIEDIRYCMHEQILDIGPRQFFRAGENLCQLEKLENLLAMPCDRREQDMPGFPVLLTRLNDGTLRAILVQEILDSREVVMKKFGKYVPRSQGVVGAVILGNGSVAPVIDLVELLQLPANQIPNLHIPALQSADSMESGQSALRALVVDDSLSARRAMTQVLKDAGYEVRTANDGLDAVDILSKFIPDIILSDMEMPRMNGLELTAHVRYAERTRHIPVIMITSRSTEKHRQMSSAAGVDLHIVKPFNDDILLQHVAKLTAR